MRFFRNRWQNSRFFRGEQVGSEPLVLNHRRIFILPTARGLGFSALMAVLAMMAFVYNNNLIYLLTFLLAGVFFVSILYCYRSLSGLIVQPGACRPVFAGESAIVSIRVDNPATADKAQVGIFGHQSDLTIKAGGSEIVAVYEKTTKRGWHDIGTITLFSTFPTGLFRAWSPLRFNLKVLVYPQPAPFSRPFPESVFEFANDRFRENRRNQGGDDFSGLQEYRNGDSIKRIHWKAFAKGQGLYSKQYGGESALHVWLDYEDMPDTTVEERLSRLCRWVVDAEKAGIAFGFSLPGLRLAPECSERHVKRCLQALALY